MKRYIGKPRATIDAIFSRVSMWFMLLISTLFGTSVAAAETRPNIIFILADDMGYGDVSKYSCTDYVTTNIDRIANEGVMLTRAYAWPVCSPSRAAFLTGMDPKRVNVPSVLLPSSTTALNTNSYTIAEHLKRSGYATALVGKWHLGYSGGSLPLARGFDSFFGFLGGQINYTNYYYSTDASYDLYDGTVNVSSSYQGRYCTRVFTQKALDFIDANTNRPFFLYLAYNAPHYPLANYDTNVTAQYKYISNQNRRYFAAMVRVMDDGIGEILNRLAARGLSSNTIVWFMTDNGPMLNQGGLASPLKGQKFSVDEGGIRLPAVVKWPARIPAGTTCDEPIRISDLFPTFSAAAGEPVPSSLRLDGTNVLSCLTGQGVIADRTLVTFNDGNFTQRAVINGDWKMVNTNGTPAIYNLASDLQETSSLSASESSRIAALEQAASNQWQSITKGLYDTNCTPDILKFRGPKL